MSERTAEQERNDIIALIDIEKRSYRQLGDQASLREDQLRYWHTALRLVEIVDKIRDGKHVGLVRAQ